MNEILDKIRSDIKPILKDARAELFDISLKRASNGTILTLLVDTEKGISIGECAVINKRVSAVLEEKNIISEKYVVEVASPGLDRPLKSQKDFKKAAGERVDIWLFEHAQGKDFVSGVVKKAGDNSVEIEGKNGDHIILPYDKINKAKRSTLINGVII
jgi:ribosome maturation factor RimP